MVRFLGFVNIPGRACITKRFYNNFTFLSEKIIFDTAFVIDDPFPYPHILPTTVVFLIRLISFRRV